jgi:hypothetical protein
MTFLQAFAMAAKIILMSIGIIVGFVGFCAGTAYLANKIEKRFGFFSALGFMVTMVTMLFTVLIWAEHNFK